MAQAQYTSEQKERRLAAVRRFRKNNPGYDAEWRLKNIEKVRKSANTYATKRRAIDSATLYARTNEWRAKNQDQIKAYRKEYYAKTRDKYLPLNNQWNQENFERSRPVRQKYVREHLAEARLHNAKRRTKIQGPKIKLEEIGNWLTRICGICSVLIQKDEKYDIDHKIPLAKGGLHVASNLQLAHRRCNRRKGAKLPDGYSIETIL